MIYFISSMTRIAIIEDDSVISQMYRMKFEADGFDVQVANNGRDGVALVEDFSPDIILLDIQMTIMNGDEALKVIRSRDWGKTIPVLILTNLGEEEAPKDIRSLGIESYIVKADLTPRQVVERVKTTLGLEE
ncbi:response regulator [Patescibacteria group bacterium]|nr:MAG: response regulator [Patescibacteria group bacterium]